MRELLTAEGPGGDPFLVRVVTDLFCCPAALRRPPFWGLVHKPRPPCYSVDGTCANLECVRKAILLAEPSSPLRAVRCASKPLCMCMCVLGGAGGGASRSWPLSACVCMMQVLGWCPSVDAEQDSSVTTPPELMVDPVQLYSQGAIAPGVDVAVSWRHEFLLCPYSRSCIFTSLSLSLSPCVCVCVSLSLSLSLSLSRSLALSRALSLYIYISLSLCVCVYVCVARARVYVCVCVCRRRRRRLSLCDPHSPTHTHIQVAIIIVCTGV